MAVIHAAMLHKIIVPIYLFVLLLSCTQAPDMKTNGGIKVLIELDAEGYSKAALERTRTACMEIFQKRLENMYGYPPNIFADSDPSRIRIEVAGARNQQTLMQVLTQSANLQFCETFTFAELSTDLSKLFGNRELLASMPSFHIPPVDTYGNTPVMAYALARDSVRINDFLASQKFTDIFGSSVGFLWSAEAVNQQGEFELIAVRMKSKNKFTSKMIENAESVEDRGGMAVSVQFTERGARQWHEFTRHNVGRFVAITLDNRVYSYPLVNAAITSNETIISGNFSKETADDLSALLNAGRLPVGVMIVSIKKVRGQVN